MKKKLTIAALALFMITAAASTVSALDFNFTKFAEGVGDQKFHAGINMGIGALPYDLSLPAIQASFEYNVGNQFLNGLPITAGVCFGVTGYDNKGDPKTLAGQWTGSLIGIGVKGNWHIDLGIPNLDTYGGLTLGILLWPEQNVFTHNGGEQTNDFNHTTMLYGINLGVKYYFTEMIGAYLEVGYSQISIVQLGLALKF